MGNESRISRPWDFLFGVVCSPAWMVHPRCTLGVKCSPASTPNGYGLQPARLCRPHLVGPDSMDV
eukprot:2483235-Amphidinium_carterae.1